MPEPRPRVAIIDYGMGNLFSVRQACEHAGMDATTTSDPRVVDGCDAVILPGVGAFGDAMATLRRHGLVDALRAYASSGRPLVGICLGLQMFMSESHEFGVHEGLGLLRGRVVRLENPKADGRALKVPHVGWASVTPVASWTGTPLADARTGEPFYFVHSYHVLPEEPGVVLATAEFGGARIVSAVAKGNVFACQFHPERSGPAGLRVYDRLVGWVRERSAGSGSGGLS